jgi:Tol biopolymer transport system component
LVFSSYAQLSPEDADEGRDVYRYDASTGALARVSVGENGNAANGNESGFDARLADIALGSPPTFRQRGMDSREVSEDGSRIVFTTAEPLSAGAVNKLSNAYEWHEGAVSLVSTGSASRSVETALISASGNDIFFTTTQGLVPQDTDGQEDVYDATTRGAASPSPAEPAPCSGDACQGPLTNPAPLLVPGSVSQTPGGNFLSPITKPVAKPKPRAKSKAKSKKKKKKRSSKKRGRAIKAHGRGKR